MRTLPWKRCNKGSASPSRGWRSIPLSIPCLAIALLALAAAPLQAQFVLTFEGLQQGEEILNYYNGGAGNLGSGPGPNYGVTFGSAALALESGNFALNPTPPTILYFLSGSAVMNVPAGFTTGFSFYYASGPNAGSVTVWDQTNAAGTQLAAISLPATGSNCGGNSATFSCWNPIGVSFSGTAKSVDFGGIANEIGFDNITFGSATPSPTGTPTAAAPLGVPTLSGWAMGLLAIGLIFVVWRRLRANPA